VLCLVRVGTLDHDVDVAQAAADGRRRARGGGDLTVVDRQHAVPLEQPRHLGDTVVLQP
jgi:hypothetical protein